MPEGTDPPSDEPESKSKKSVRLLKSLFDVPQGLDLNPPPQPPHRALDLDKALLAAADWIDPPGPRHKSPADLAEAGSQGRWRRTPHLDALSTAITETVENAGRLIVAMPPRHGKSELASHWTPVWFLDRWPARRVVLASYASTFAATWGRRARNTAIELGRSDSIDLRLAADSQSRSDWLTTRDGGMLTVGVGGPITGRGAELLLIDDPVKNAAEAYSPTIRESVWEWWTTTARTRLEPGGAIIVIMTRWHHDDLAGRLINGTDVEHADDWRVLSLPAVADDEDQLGRAPGAPLWPDRYDLDSLMQIKASVGPVSWDALFQQQPTTEETGIFPRKAWRWYDEQRWLANERGVHTAVHDGVLWMSVDCAFKVTDGSDYVVVQVWQQHNSTRWLLDQARGRMSFTDTCRTIEDMSRKWPEARAKLIEDKANGPAVVDHLKGSIEGMIPVNPLGGKLARAHAVAPLVHAGNVLLPNAHLAPWIDDFVTECAMFPVGTHDDQVDALTQALAHQPVPRPQLVTYYQPVSISPM